LKKYGVPILCGLVTGILNGLFGAGGGIMAVVFLEKFMKFPSHKAHGAAVAVILAVTPVSLFFYLKNGLYDVSLTWQAALGGIAGGIVGAKLLPKINDKWLHGIFGGFMILAAARLLFR
jgi:uncharacterized membrane protein YfcA